MITVVIPTWNRAELLAASLRALRCQTSPEFEVLVVDNGSTDGTLELLSREFPEVRVLALAENRGFTGAANAGIRAARGGEVALLNNDAEPEPGWLEALERRLASDEGLGMVASLMLWHAAPGVIDSAGDGFTIAGFGYKRGYRQRLGPPFDEPCEVFSACGGAVLMRRKMLEEVGAYDPSFFAFGEDLDLAFRARLAGWRVMFEPEARVRHHVRATATTAQALRLGYRNLYTLLAKNLPGPLWILYAPHILLHTLVVMGGYLLKGQGLAVFAGLLEALVRLPATLGERRRVQALRTAPLRDIRRILEGNWVGIMMDLSGLCRRIRGEPLENPPQA